MRTPVALIIFNRPDTTEQVFSKIAEARPPQLFVIADGPRAEYPEDIGKCAAARSIIERVDWECDVFKNYSDINLGCGKRPATGISWVFENVSEAIILEDDCVPDITFFHFCDEILAKYRDDERVMSVNGRNDICGQHRMLYSYGFVHMMSCWGWATWRRAWKHYDVSIRLWPELRSKNWLSDIFSDKGAVEYWKNIFNHTYKNHQEIDYWDYQWALACWAQNGLTILPKNNLVQNIGFGEHATHTKGANHDCAKLINEQISFPLRYPPYVVRDTEADQCLNDKFIPRKIGRRNWHSRYWNKLKSAFKLFLIDFQRSPFALVRKRS